MAGFPVAQGEQSYHGTYIPEIWSSKLQVKFYAGTALTDISSTDYEGEIKDKGDTVKIRTQPDIQPQDYEKGQALVTQQPNPSVIDLTIDKGKYFQFPIHPVDTKQSDIAYVNKWAEDGSEQVKIAVETGVYADIYSDAAAANMGATAGAKTSSYNMGVTATPVVLTKDNVLDYIVDIGSVLCEQDVPETMRWLVIPVWMAGLIKKSDLKDASLTGDSTSPLRTGLIGMIDTFKIYRSNLLSSVVDTGNTCYRVLAGHPTALTFATQIVRTEVIDNPFDFGKLHRFLQVYGYKVIKPESLVHFYCRKG